MAYTSPTLAGKRVAEPRTLDLEQGRAAQRRQRCNQRCRGFCTGLRVLYRLYGILEGGDRRLGLQIGAEASGCRLELKLRAADWS